MKIENGLSGKHEYNATVEDISIRLLVNDGFNPFPDNIPIIPHTHLYTELFVCLSGQISIQTDLEDIQLSKGDAAIIPANMSHSKMPDNNPELWHAVGFMITKKQGNTAANLHKKLKSICKITKPLVFRNVPEIGERVAQLHNPIYKDDDFLPARELACILSKLSTLQIAANISEGKPLTRTPDIYRMAWFEDLIANRYYEPLTTSTLANMLHISPRHLSRIIKEQYGITFHEILIQKRLDVASKLLTETNESVNSILKQVGYTKSSCFYKDFSTRYNMTPTEYRNNF